jgi:hypothetical protein
MLYPSERHGFISVLCHVCVVCIAMFNSVHLVFLLQDTYVYSGVGRCSVAGATLWNHLLEPLVATTIDFLVVKLRSLSDVLKRTFFCCQN